MILIFDYMNENEKRIMQIMISIFLFINIFSLDLGSGKSGLRFRDL